MAVPKMRDEICSLLNSIGSFQTFTFYLQDTFFEEGMGDFGEDFDDGGVEVVPDSFWMISTAWAWEKASLYGRAVMRASYTSATAIIRPWRGIL